MKHLNNLFIQSFMDDFGKTFLEVGSTKPEDVDAGIFTSVPTAFYVTSNGTCWIDVSKNDFAKISNKWGVTQDDVKKALQKQWKDNDSDALVIFQVI